MARYVSHKLKLKGPFDGENIDVSLARLTYLASEFKPDGENFLTWYTFNQEIREPVRVVEIQNQSGVQVLSLGNPIGMLAPARQMNDGT